MKLTLLLSLKTLHEAKAFGFMMKALRIKFLCQDSKLRDLIEKTNQCIECVVNEDNRRDLKGHWNVTLSCWYHHQGKFQKARLFLDRAKPEQNQSWFPVITVHTFCILKHRC